MPESTNSETYPPPIDFIQSLSVGGEFMINEDLIDISDSAALWIFGYGSLMWYPGFAYQEVRRCKAVGFARRMWQGNTTCRGSIALPGRVATILPEANSETYGLLYKVCGLQSIIAALDHLWVREIETGYNFESIRVQLLGDGPIIPVNNPTEVEALTVIAWPGNPFFLDGQHVPVIDMAEQIAHAKGAKGRNLDYVLKMAEAMRLNFPGVGDSHLFGLESYLLKHLEALEGTDPNAVKLGPQAC